MRHIPFLFLFLILSLGSAQAQTRGAVVGLGGVTFGTETAAQFGGHVVGDVTDNVQVYGSLVRMQNVLPRYVQEDLDDASALLTALTGVRWDFSAKAPAVVGSGGVRLFAKTDQVRPYVLGGLGFAKVNGTIREIDFGDITDELIADGYLDRGDVEATKFLWEVGGGIEVPAGPLLVDVGYRFRKLTGVDEGFNISSLGFGLGVRF